jgi:hypothetical protein
MPPEAIRFPRRPGVRSMKRGVTILAALAAFSLEASGA